MNLSKADELFYKLGEEKRANKQDGKRLSKSQSFLLSIKDKLTWSLKKKLSVGEITDMIIKAYSFKISEQTVRAFIKNDDELSQLFKANSKMKDDNVSKDKKNKNKDK